jgi:hypothetical protein
MGNGFGCARLLVDDSRSWVLYSDDGCGARLLVDDGRSRLLYRDRTGLNMRSLHNDSAGLRALRNYCHGADLGALSKHCLGANLGALGKHGLGTELGALGNYCLGTGLGTRGIYSDSTVGESRYRSDGRSARGLLRNYNHSSRTRSRGGHGDCDDGRGCRNGRDDG